MSKPARTWEEFEAAARPIIEAYICEHGVSPGQGRFRRMGLAWIVSAAHKQFGGWRKMLRRMNLPQVKRRPGQVAGYKPPGYWSDDENVLSQLWEFFPDLLIWQTMPTTKMVQAKLMGLWCHAARTGGLAALTRRLRLLPYRRGMQFQQRVKDIGWVLEFYEAHGRWPYSRECPYRIREGRFFRGTSWHDYCRPVGMPQAGLQLLVVRFEQHREWLRRNKPAKVLTRQRVLNYLVIDLQRRYPPLSA